MTEIAEDLKRLLHLSTPEGESDPDLEFLWVYEPPAHEGEEGKIHLENADAEDPLDDPTHETMATHVTHPDRVEGYAYTIKGGWRITNDEHKGVDPYIKRLVLKALRGEVPTPPLPHIRYHGDPA